MYIFHKGEDGDKDHIHLRIVPNTRLNPMELTEFFKEPDLKFPDKKPLGVRPWQPSKEEDWFLYAVHDPKYMKLKYKDDPHEKLEYKDSDVIVSDMFDSEIAFIRARASLAHHATNLLDRMRSGSSALDLVECGESVTIVRTLQMIMGNYHSQVEFDKVSADLHFALAQKYQLEQFVMSQGFIVNYDSKGELTIVKDNSIIESEVNNYG